MKTFSCLWLFISMWLFPLFGTSILETTPFPSFCQKAAEDKQVFANFKREAIYKNSVESVSYETGKQYLDIISQEYPELVSLFDQFRQNDAIGNPITHDYGNYGFFSPTTFRYIKVAGDLKHRFGDMSQMHIVEIGMGSATLCKILFDLGGFASYTFVDLPQCNALTKKCLEKLGVKNVFFIDKANLSQLKGYDLVISNYSFSECDLNEQNRYLEKLISSTPRGYLAMNFINIYFRMSWLSIDDLVAFLYCHGMKGKIEKERPATHPDNLLVTWEKPTSSSLPSPIKELPQLTPSSSFQKGNAITYTLNGRRLGDNLLAYLHARWLSYKYGLPLLYLPFHFSDQFNLDEMDQPSNNTFSFEQFPRFESEDQIQTTPTSSLYVIPFFPESRVEWGCVSPFSVDWNDPEFKAEALKCLASKQPVESIFLPKNGITVGVHVRKGSGSDLPSQTPFLPLKFPPDSYYIQQIERISKILNNQPLYVHIFTDSAHPDAMAERFKAALNNPNIVFAYDKGEGNSDKQVLKDFFSIPKVDCLIIPQSNFSLIHSKLKEFAILIAPLHSFNKGNEVVIDQVELTFNGSRPITPS